MQKNRNKNNTDQSCSGGQQMIPNIAEGNLHLKDPFSFFGKV